MRNNPVDSPIADDSGWPLGSELSDSAPASPSLNFVRRSGDVLGAQAVGLSGVAGFGLAWGLARWLNVLEKAPLLLLFFGCAAIPMMLLNLKVIKTQRRASSGLQLVPGPIHWRRCGVKFAGIGLTLGALSFLYWLFPEYSRVFYQPVWSAALMVAVPGTFLTVIYVIWVDRRMVDPYDSCWHVGLLALGRWSEFNVEHVRGHCAGWLVKGFFLPLMAAGAAVTLSNFVKDGLDLTSFGSLYSTGVNLVYAVDVSFGAIGYILTLRLLDAQIRSVESTPLGWASALICYVPFSTFVWGAFLKYRGQIQWHDWLIGMPVVYVTWGFMIIVLLSAYAWATISFGCRFSNLTNRGIVVDGPYRFMKHPAYVSKNLAWWLLYVPFAAHSTWDLALKGCICLFLTNVVYFVRARTEERHLSADPAYEEYCRWVERNGLGAQLKYFFTRLERS